MGESGDVRSVRLVDRWLGIETELTLEQPATVWRCPIETVSLSEGGLERVYQSSMIVPHWRFRLAKTFSVRLRQSVRRLVREGTKKGSLT